MTTQPHTGNQAGKWTKADKMNGAGVLVAILGLVGGVLVPNLWHLHNYLNRPQASISWPNEQAKIPNNAFGAQGTAHHIPTDSDLWLIVRSGIEGRWYPDERLTVTDGSWQVPKNMICPASGPQELVIYLVPDSAEGSLFAYKRSAAQKGLGMNSVPIGSTVMALVTVHVANSKRTGC
jgi:hypothetical protein